MKKVLIPVVALLFAACNSNHTQSDPFPNDTSQNNTRPMNPTDTTSTINDKAYNTTDTGASKGSIIDSSGMHTLGNTSNQQDSSK